MITVRKSGLTNRNPNCPTTATYAAKHGMMVHVARASGD